MVELRQGRVSLFERISPLLCMLRIVPEDGRRFPDYLAGQYVALRRDDCKLTKRVLDAAGRPTYVPDLDEKGNQRTGPVTHSYSIASAPFETVRDRHLEFYIVLEKGPDGMPGRLTGSLFAMDPALGDQVGYFDRITGDFTLARRAAGHQDVCMVGTGTGVAPFVSMLKQLDHEAQHGQAAPARSTLFYANRSRAELPYHEELLAIAAAGRLDLVYVPALSRPTPEDAADSRLGRGRANNLLRFVLDMPLKEEEDRDAAAGTGEDVAAAEDALRRAVLPALGAPLTRARLQERLLPGQAVILTCGNATSMADIKYVADARGIRFEKEDWKPAPVAQP
jgi:ferredoxin-NADP reductase